MINSHQAVREANEKIMEINYDLSHKRILQQHIPEALQTISQLETDIQHFQKAIRVKLASENGEQV